MPSYALSTIEIIYNPLLDPQNQYIYLYTYYFENLLGLGNNQTLSNQTLMSISANDGYLMMYQQD
jgi:hypothetical protein